MLAQGRPEAAVPAFTEALRLNPHSFEHLHNRALALHRSRRKKPALADVDLALSLHPMAAGTHVLRGAILSSMGRRRTSRQATRRALELDPGIALAHNNQGVDLLRQGRIGVAVSAFERALAQDPQDPLVRHNLDAVLITVARRGFLLGLAAMVLCFGAVELLWAPAVRALFGCAVVGLMFVLVLSPFRRLSVGGRRHLIHRVKQDRFLLFACGLGVFSGGLALLVSLLPPDSDEVLGRYLAWLFVVNLVYGLWASRWAAERRRRTAELASEDASDAVEPARALLDSAEFATIGRSTPTASHSSAWCGARSMGTTYWSRPSRSDAST